VLIVVFHQRFYKFGAGTALALTTATPIVILALYGLAWWFAAAATGRHWLFAVAVGSFASALLMASTPPMMVLIGAISLLLLAFVPGLILAFAARRKAASP
jgi:hypothetical protein